MPLASTTMSSTLSLHGRLPSTSGFDLSSRRHRTHDHFEGPTAYFLSNPKQADNIFAWNASKQPNTVPIQLQRLKMRARSNPAIVKAMSKTPRKRDASVELGDGDFAIDYNSKTGRPIRKSAGHRDFFGAYAKHEDIQSDSGEMSEMSEEDIIDDDLDASTTKRALQLQKKRKARGQPARLTTLTPPPNDNYQDTGEFEKLNSEEPLLDSDDEESEHMSVYEHTSGPDVLNLTFNIAPGFQGPLRIQVPRSAFYGTAHPNKRVRTSDYHSDTTSFRASPVSSIQKSHAHAVTPKKRSWGWTKLPAELRNRIYRLVFFHPDVLSFHHPKNFTLSSQFLATCHQVHEEGRTILYSENKFSLERNKSRRAPYWSPEPKEIGWKDVRYFVSETIGIYNLGLLRDVTFICEDAMPSTTPTLTTEERRFIYDANLIEVLRLFGRHGQLRTLKLCLMGRKTLMRCDEAFLSALRKVKADQVKIIRHPRWGIQAEDESDGGYWSHNDSKVHPHLKEQIIQTMTRKRKMYPSSLP